MKLNPANATYMFLNAFLLHRERKVKTKLHFLYDSRTIYLLRKTSFFTGTNKTLANKRKYRVMRRNEKTMLVGTESKEIFAPRREVFSPSASPATNKEKFPLVS